MNKMREKQIEKWERIRKVGKSKYIFHTWVLKNGIITAIIWSISMQLIEPQEKWFVRPLIALLLFPIGGILTGNLVWNSGERKYKRNKSI